MRRHTTACAYWNVHGQSGWIIRRQVLFATPAFVYTSALTDEALLEAVYCARAVLQLQARRLLRPDGLFLGAMLGGSTLQQLRRGGPPCPMRWLSRLCMLCMLPPPRSRYTSHAVHYNEAVARRMVAHAECQNKSGV